MGHGVRRVIYGNRREVHKDKMVTCRNMAVGHGDSRVTHRNCGVGAWR